MNAQQSRPAEGGLERFVGASERAGMRKGGRSSRRMTAGLDDDYGLGAGRAPSP